MGRVGQLKFCFVLLVFVALLFNSFEATAVISLLTLGFILSQKKLKVSKRFFSLLLFPILILAISLVMGVIYNPIEYDFLKDFFYLSKPVFFIIIGYLVTKKIDSNIYLYKVVVACAICFSIIHLFLVSNYLFNTSDYRISAIRNYGGKDNVFELFALCFLLANLKFKKIQIKHQWIVIATLFSSFVLYFSRTMVFVFVFMLIAFLGYIKISTKGVKYIFTAVLLITALYVYLFSVEIPRESENPIDNFLYKLKIAPSEIFVSQGSIDVEDHAKLWDHWRAFEANKAIEQVIDASAIHWFFGLGAGSLIDLGFYAPLSNEKEKGMRYISTLHNGYAFIFYKAGILGILLYTLFFIYGYSTMKYFGLNTLSSNIVTGIVVFYLITSFVISGLYNTTDPMSLLLGSFFSQFEKEHNEGSNNRH